MTQVTLVSMYGDKHDSVAALLMRCQELVAQELGDAFEPYDLRQIHATIVGLERRGATSADNANFAVHRGRQVSMDLQGFLAYLRACDDIPFDVQIGGFGKRDCPFTSRAAPPHERSFSVQGDKLVLMGWPVGGEPLRAAPHRRDAGVPHAPVYPATLDTIRRAAQRFGVLHAYHRAPTDIDNDLFLRIGLVRGSPLDAGRLGALETRIRQYLGDRPPLIATIGRGDISIVAYADDRLPLHSTRAWRLTDPALTGQLVATLFR